VEQEVDIISYSLGTYFGAGDGTGLESALAQWAYEGAGITWVTSAGNGADDHWSGTFNDPDDDGWHNFSGEDELLSFIVPADLGIEYGIDAYLKWNDWGTWDDYYGYSGSDQDFDLYLFIEIGGQWHLVDTSENRQPQFKWPWESIEGWYSDIDTRWGVAIRKNQASNNVFFDLYIPIHTTGTLEYNVPEGSLSAPADSPYVIAVGAVDAVEDYYHHYSSQGPTSDGRIKPDLCAPSWVSTSDTSYGLRSVGDGFAGTSASCPHVAGAIALLKGKTPFTLEEIKSILYSRAIDMGEPGMDNIYGRGRLNLRRQ
jgi:subtilisin family serine protease